MIESIRRYTRPDHFCALAGTWDFKTIPAAGCMAEEKRDGWRALYFRDHRGKPRLWTRNGLPIEGVGHILHKLVAMEAVAGEPMFFDGEFQVDDCLSATKKWCESGYKLGGEAGSFFAFDCLTEREWRANNCNRPLIQRKKLLNQLFDESANMIDEWEWRPGTYGKEPDKPAVQIIHDEWCNDAQEVIDLAQRVWACGGEGLVIKDAESLYRRERIKSWRKVKSPKYQAR